MKCFFIQSWSNDGIAWCFAALFIQSWLNEGILWCVTSLHLMKLFVCAGVVETTVARAFTTIACKDARRLDLWLLRFGVYATFGQFRWTEEIHWCVHPLPSFDLDYLIKIEWWSNKEVWCVRAHRYLFTSLRSKFICIGQSIRSACRFSLPIFGYGLLSFNLHRFALLWHVPTISTLAQPCSWNPYFHCNTFWYLHVLWFVNYIKVYVILSSKHFVINSTRVLILVIF